MPQLGPPMGNKNATKNRPFAAAIERALARAELAGDFNTLNALAERVIAMACDGDIDAVKVIAERLDGRPHQAVDVTTRRVESLHEEQARDLAESFLEASKRAAARVIDVPATSVNHPGEQADI